MKRKTLYVAVVCCLLLMGCKHKPTADEIAAVKADSIANEIAMFRAGFPVTDLLTLPNVKWAVINEPGLLVPDTLILAAAVDGKVCITDIYSVNGVLGTWVNVLDERVDFMEPAIRLRYENINSLAKVVDIKLGSFEDIAASCVNKNKVNEQKIRDFCVEFYSLPKEKQKNLLTQKARRALAEVEGNSDFTITGGYSAMGGVWETYPQTIKIVSIDNSTGCVTFTQEVYVVGNQGGQTGYAARQTEEYSLWLQRDNDSFLVNDIAVPFSGSLLGYADETM